MKRIFVTGNAGAGKSTLANSLGQALGFPVYGLDRIVWQAGWRKTPDDEKKGLIKQLINCSDNWVIEGVSQTVMMAADTIIFLDVARHICLWRCAKRNRRYLFQSRPNLPEQCPEILIIPELLRIVWNFPKIARPLLLEHLDLHQQSKTVYVVKNHADLQNVLSLLKPAEDSYCHSIYRG